AAMPGKSQPCPARWRQPKREAGELCGWNRRLHSKYGRCKDTRMYRGATSVASGRAGSQAASTKANAAGEQSPTGKFRNGATPYAIVLAKRLGLRYVASDALSIRRARRGRGWIYIGHNQHPIRDPKIIRRLARLAVPPAYGDVLYATDPD